ncbi:Hachiman antiphage defense system protein HamA [Aeromonas caviae]|uniref:Hachiman antiphage defense system protein HamA n=1 Tax=Aeromonas caviae TaxID=648 RepID=UPI0033067E1A
MPPSFFSPDTTWTGTQILLSEQHCDGSRPFDAHQDRFTFVLFVGYDSRLLTDPETPGYEDNLEKETLELFDNFVADLIEGSPFADLCVHVFIYPAPSLERLTQLVEDKVREVV